MIKVVSINRCKYGSTGAIARSIAHIGMANGVEVYQAYPCHPQNMPEEGNDIKICSYSSYRINQKLGYISGYNDCFSFFSTKKFLKTLDVIGPDIIHLHNLHSGFINLTTLFNYISRKSIKVVWTMHDAWPITGGCPHFVIAGCELWRIGCHDCPQKNDYPRALVDRSKQLWDIKNRSFNKINQMVIVSPSNWLKGLINDSYLYKYGVTIINNGIDLSIYKRIESNLRDDLGLRERKVVLGAAFLWNDKKGLDVFIELSKRLNSDYKIVLVGGMPDGIDLHSAGIIAAGRVNSAKTMAEYYSMADVFVNPTREDTYSNVNMEAIACGTPVITYNTTGACEMIDDTCGVAVAENDIDDIYRNIVKICESRDYYRDNCVNKAKDFDENSKFLQYVDLYKKIMEDA